VTGKENFREIEAENVMKSFDNYFDVYGLFLSHRPDDLKVLR